MRNILDTCYEEAVRLLTENRKQLDDIAAYLLEKETITGEEMMQFIDPPKEESAPAEEEKPEAAAPAEEVKPEAAAPTEENQE